MSLFLYAGNAPAANLTVVLHWRVSWDLAYSATVGYLGIQKLTAFVAVGGYVTPFWGGPTWKTVHVWKHPFAATRNTTFQGTAYVNLAIKTPLSVNETYIVDTWAELKLAVLAQFPGTSASAVGALANPNGTTTFRSYTVQ